MNGKQIAAIIIVLILAYVAYDSVFTVNPRQRVVLVQVGRIVGQNYAPGLHFKLPFIQHVRAFDKRTRTLAGKINRALTSENKNLSVDYFVKWRIDDTVKYYLSTHGSSDSARALLTQSVENDLLAEYSKRTMQQAIDGNRNQIVAAVQVQVNQYAKSLGIHIVDVRIMQLNLPKKVSKSVYDRMRSKRQEVIRTLRAQGDAAAKEIRADAERERTVILAKAYKQAQTIKGQGDAAAAKTYGQAYKQDADFYSFYRSLQVYRESIGKNDLLLLKPDGKLFKYFNPAIAAGAGIGQ
ncbi:MAG: protease modulator HflC [Salinisphaera sp.]|jgi:membrane protease subunit HflC|nr:protease modulator HflC [Salinisphaera sp.]